jgi:SOS-response transcriptional repressor LexA
MNKYENLKEQLTANGTGRMKCFGSSMTPIIESGAMITFVKQDEYEIGDIVFCKVKGRYIDAHKITKKDAEGRYMISNNHGHDNGWTKTIFGRATEAEYPTKKKKL